jgi:hypothetical protein
MTYSRLALAFGTVVAAVIVPMQASAEPPTKCLTNTPKGKQVYVPCDLLDAGANFPPGQRCPPPLEQYPKDVADWCGEGPGLASTTPTSPPSTSPTSPTSPTNPASPTSPTSHVPPTTPASTTTPATPSNNH